MKFSHKNGPPESRFPVGGIVADSIPLANGRYVRTAEDDDQPVNATALLWPTSTTVTNDVGVNDHTTYVETIDAVKDAVTKLLIVGPARTLSTWTGAIYGEVPTLRIYWSINGTDWTQWDAQVPAPGLGAQWFDLSGNPADQAGVIYEQRILTSSKSADPTAIARIGDARTS